MKTSIGVICLAFLVLVTAHCTIASSEIAGRQGVSRSSYVSAPGYTNSRTGVNPNREDRAQIDWCIDQLIPERAAAQQGQEVAQPTDPQQAALVRLDMQNAIRECMNATYSGYPMMPRYGYGGMGGMMGAYGYPRMGTIPAPATTYRSY